MPRYDYRCNECREEFEAEHAIGGRDTQTCPDCGSTSTRKIILQTPAIHIHWWNSLASDAITPPKQLGSVKNRRRLSNAHSSR